VNKTVAFLFSLLELVAVTYENLEISITMREAKTLLIIYNLHAKFTLNEIHEEYILNFGECDVYQLAHSIKILEKLLVVERIDQFEYKLIEKIRIKYK
jgi:hypothetical protein